LRQAACKLAFGKLPSMTLHKVQQYWYEIQLRKQPVASIVRGGEDMWRVFDRDNRQILGPYFGPLAAFEDYKAMIRRKGIGS